MMNPVINRLELLRLLGVAGVSLGASCPPAPKPYPAHVPDPAIDAHCHVFNGSDLPVAGFVSQIELETILAESPLASVKEFIIGKISDLLLTFSAGYQDEIAFLAGRPSAPEPRDLYRQAVMLFISDATAGDPPGSAAPAAMQADPQHAPFVAQLISSMAPGALSYLQADPTQAVKVLNPEDILGDDPFALDLEHYLGWAEQMVDYRIRNIDRLFQLFGPERQGVTVATPAMVDFHRWLNAADNGLSVDESLAPKVPISDQVDLMIQVIRQRPNVLPFVPIDPRNDWSESLKLLELCFGDLDPDWTPTGFVGVKVYPPLGFSPSDNSHIPKFFGNAIEAFALQATVETNLDALYRYCSENDVPIMTHCNQSNYAPLGRFGDTGNAALWQPVMKRYPALRLNLGHFGDVGGFASNPGDGIHTTIGAMWKAYPRVYADVSDAANVSVPAFRSMLASSYSAFYATNPEIVQRLMFGTDWDILGVTRGFETFLDDWSAAVDGIAALVPQPDLRHRFFFDNAAAFLGFTDKNSRNRGRIARHYTALRFTPAWF